ncbi:MAG: dienelactone hydrolase family protein [Bacteroidota bacterium]
MKSILIGLFSFFLILPSPEERKIYPEVEFCHPADSFANLASDPDFLVAHFLPESLVGFEPNGKMIQLSVEEGKDANAYILKADQKSEKWLFVIHEWWGLNDHIKKESEKYFNALGDFNVLALDLYDGKVATDRKKAAEYMQSCSKERAEAIIKSAYEFAGENAAIGSIGWCFGGGWSLQTGIIGKERAQASIIYYGMPEKDPDRLAQLEASVLGIFAKQEKWITPEIVGDFEEQMNALNKSIEVHMYDAQHAFANPSRPSYEKEYADEAFALSLNFLKEKVN